ncbi:SurA N-terminal domain-containing protein [bacterium]|nr:SurA N-terminal domain-containing protein [bacterium]
MSISKIRKTVQKRIKVASWILAGLFFLSIPAYFSFRGPGPLGGEESVGYIAKIGKVKIDRQTFESILERERDKYPFASGPEGQMFLRLQVLNNIIDEMVLNEALRREKIKVSEKEIKKYIEDRINEEIERERKEKKEIKDEKGLRESLRRALESQKEAVRRELMLKKLQEKLASRVRVTEEDLKASYKEVHLRGIKVSSEAEAKELMEKAKGQDFSALAKQYYSSHGEKDKKDDMGWLPLEMLPFDLREKLKGLKKGDLTIANVGGSFYLLKLEDERIKLPKDYEKNKEKLLKDYEEMKKQTALSEYKSKLQRELDIQIYDPFIKVAEAFQRGDLKLAQQNIQKALKIYPDEPNLLFLLARIYEETGKEEEALRLYERVALSSYFGSAYYRWGLLLEKKGKKKEALENFKKAAQYAGPDIVLHSSLKEKFTQYGLQNEAKKEEEAINRLSLSQKIFYGGGNGP